MAIVQVNWRPDARRLRWFGLVGTVVFCTLAGVATVRLTRMYAEHVPWGMVEPWMILVPAWLAIGIWTVFAIFRPQDLRPFYLALTAVSLPIGIVVSYAILAAMYFVIFTPIGLTFRLFGRDALNRRLDRGAETYWTPRRRSDDVRRYFRQF